VIAVNEIDVGVPGRAEQNRVTCGAAGSRMRCGIGGAEVRFDFHDSARQKRPALAAYQDFAQQIPADPPRIAIVKLTRQRFAKLVHFRASVDLCVLGGDGSLN